MANKSVMSLSSSIINIFALEFDVWTHFRLNKQYYLLELETIALLSHLKVEIDILNYSILLFIYNYLGFCWISIVEINSLTSFFNLSRYTGFSNILSIIVMYDLS